MLSPILLAWVLMATVSTVQCTGTDCKPTLSSQLGAGPHKLAVFATLQACATYRQHMQATRPQAVQVPPQPEMTIRQDYVFTCQASEESP